MERKRPRLHIRHVVTAMIIDVWAEEPETHFLRSKKQSIRFACRQVYHLGRVILREDHKVSPAAKGSFDERAKSRSWELPAPNVHHFLKDFLLSRIHFITFCRSNSPDLTRSRGQSRDEMLDELRAKQRERAVCSTGKDYHKKPIGFMSGLAMKRDVGQASTRLREEETYAPRQVEHRQKMPDSEILLGRPESERDREKELLKQQLFEKYGNINPRAATKEPAPADPDETDRLRLG
eukprot:Skav227663  [mRNA]  locus=scaffold58:600807:605683:- [translate_table: standard]